MFEDANQKLRPKSLVCISSYLLLSASGSNAMKPARQVVIKHPKNGKIYVDEEDSLHIASGKCGEKRLFTSIVTHPTLRGRMVSDRDFALIKQKIELSLSS